MKSLFSVMARESMSFFFYILCCYLSWEQTSNVPNFPDSGFGHWHCQFKWGQTYDWQFTLVFLRVQAWLLSRSPWPGHFFHFVFSLSGLPGRPRLNWEKENVKAKAAGVIFITSTVEWIYTNMVASTIYQTHPKHELFPKSVLVIRELTCGRVFP